MQYVKITCISENTTTRHSLLAQHGQSLLLEIDNYKYLFDIGEIYEGFAYNTSNLGIHIDDVKDIILSHNHLDHSGTLFTLVDQLKHQRLFLPPDMYSIEEKNYSKSYRIVASKELSREEAVEKSINYERAVIVDKPLEIISGLYTTGPLSGIVQEQSLIVQVPEKGLVILVGCSHPTLPVIIEKAKEITGVDTIYGLVGGFHFFKMDEREFGQYITFLEQIRPTFIIPSHCTGYEAIAEMRKRMPDIVKVSSSGQFGSGNSLQILPDLQFDLM